MDFKRYQQEFYKATNGFDEIDALSHFECPNKEELHSMICGYSQTIEDTQLFDSAESIDYFKYERQLWRESRRNQ